MTKQNQHLLGIALLSLTIFNSIGIIAMLSQYSFPYTFTYPIAVTATVKKDATTTSQRVNIVSKPVIQSKGSLPTQAQKDTVQRTCALVYENRKDMIQANNISEGIFMTTCYYDLLAMTYAESRFDCYAIGDNGKSRGCLQIQTALHNVTVEQAESYAFATAWTIDRMVRNYSYPHYRRLAVKSHNGIVPSNAYPDSVIATSDRFKAMGL